MLGAAGRACPDVDLDSARAARGVPPTASTGESGAATVKLTPTDRRGIASPSARRAGGGRPVLYVPARRDAAHATRSGSSRPRERRRASRRARRSRRRPQVVTRSAPSPRRPAARSPTRSRVSGLAGQTVTVQAALYGPIRRPTRSLHRRAGVDRQLRRRPRRQLRHRAGQARRARLLHLPRVDRRQTERHRRGDRVRRRGGDDVVPGAPQRSRRRSAPSRPARRADHRHRGRGRPRQAGGDVNVELWGPFPTRAAIRCEARRLDRHFVANGDGNSRPRR